MTEQQMPARIYAANDMFWWDDKNSGNYTRSDIAERMAEALEKITAIKNQEYGGDWDEIELARAIADHALSAFKDSAQDRGAS